MSDLRGCRLAGAFVALALAAGGALPVAASDDHEVARELRARGDLMPLAELLNRPELSGKRVLEAGLERKKGRLVYELEILDGDGRVREGYFDATTGEVLAKDWDD